jgi:diguanylate cyclase (GGDEF)-like protein/PAS domain S-box-containing protein
MIRSPRSLQTRIMLVVMGALLLGMAALYAHVSQHLRSDMQQALGDQQFATVSLVASDIDRELTDRIKALEGVAGGIDAKLLADATALQQFLDDRHILPMLFNGGYFVTNADGIATASVPPTAERVGKNYMDRDHVEAALKEGRSAISKPINSRTLKFPLISIATPIRNVHGKVLASLIGVTNLGQQNFLSRISSNRYGKTGGYLLVAPRYRLIITATDASRTMETLPPPGVSPQLDRFVDGHRGTDVFVNPKGVDVLVSAQSIPVADWYVAVILPVTEAFAPLEELQRRLLMASVLTLVLIAALTWWELRRQLSPIRQAANSLQAMTAGQERLTPLPMARNDEVGTLIGGFNHALEILKDSETRFRTLTEASPDGIVVHIGGRTVYANPAAVRLMGGQSADDLVGKAILDFVHPDFREIALQRIQRNLRDGLSAPMIEERLMRLDGTDFPVEIQGTTIDFDGSRAIQSVFRDISERKLAQENLQLAASVFSHAREGIVITDSNARIVDVNQTFTEITGFARAEVLGQNPSLLHSGRQDGDFYAAMWRDLVDKGHWYGEIWNRRKNGEVYAEMLTIGAVRDQHGTTQHYVGLFSDITAQKAHQGQLEHIAHFDALTNLPNRVLLADRLQQAMSQAARRGLLLAVAYLDLDGFKGVNDRHGHHIGDQLLVALANRVKDSLREGDTLARMGGDEFVAVMIDLPDAQASVPLLLRMLAAASLLTHIDGNSLQVSASIGVTFFPQADVDAEQLLRQADQSMYQAKLAGKNRYHLFDAAQDSSIRGHHQSVERIRQALHDQEFVLYYQPKVNMRRGTVIGVEALIRWQHPEQGLLAPDHFLPAIEDHPLAVEVGEWVLDTALCQLELWQAQGLEVPVSVNIGARQLQQTNFIERLRELLARHPGISAHRLELEVLETSALEDLALVSAVMDACQAMGIRFALDDFGTGYSSLTYLKRLPVALLKIDQTFVRDMLEDSNDLSILDGVLRLAFAFNREAIAEGVETLEHGAMLLRLGCELGQGYGIARPMPGEQFPVWAAAWQVDASWSGQSAIDPVDLPLLYAGIEHRVWTAALEKHLQDPAEQPAPEPQQGSRFERWLQTQGLQRYGGYANFSALQTVHTQLAALAAQMLVLQSQGQRAQVMQRFDELHRLDQLLHVHLAGMVRVLRSAS